VAFGFRNRLAVFLMATLVVVQGATALVVYGVTRQALITQSKHDLMASAELFGQQIDALSQRVADSVQVLSRDYPLRQAVASQNEQTVLSALRNHGRRVGATRMLWIGLDGVIRGDTVNDQRVGQTVEFPEMLDEAAAEGKARAITILDGKAYMIVLVPVIAPIPIAYIGANIPLDDAMVDTLRRLSALPREVVLATKRDTGKWDVLARSLEGEGLLDQLMPDGAPPELYKPVLMNHGARNDIVLAVDVDVRHSMPVVAVVGLSLDEALRPYAPVMLAPLGLLLLGLLATLFGTGMIARAVAKPLEALATVARQIARGDYTPPEPTEQTDEIGQLSGALGNMVIAIGEREDHIRYQATHDAVTGLFNRSSLIENVDTQLKAQPGLEASMLMVGVPRMQEIVNTLGHGFRDRLMRFVGERLSEASAGHGYVARVSDIAFAVWWPSWRPALRLAHDLSAAVGDEFREGDFTVDLVASVGIAAAPDHGTDAALLLQRADIALHDALAKVEDRIVVYDPHSDPHRSDRLSLMRDLREAVESGGLALNCQPKIDLASNMVAGAEGLIRWTHPVRGFVPPDSFIGLAEETGNIRRVTQWVLETGVRQAADWSRRGMQIRMSVNLSVRDLGDPTLAERVASLLKFYAVDPSDIVLEITESAIMGEPDAAIQMLRQLADQGIDLSIDDFGVGQSSFAYLRRLPVREIKIDKSFVLKLANSPEDATIVRSIVELGHNLGYKVTAEGVEDEASYDFLREIGCDYAQGYFIAKALPPDGFDRFIAEGKWAPRRRAKQAS
jgi:diguanylate cyclase (GGDEF)-like protein